MTQFEFFLTLAPLLAATVIIVAGYAWFQAHSPLSRTLTVYLVMVAGFLIAGILELVSISEEMVDLWVRIQYLFMPFIPVLWLRMALLYTGQIQWAALRRLWIFFLLPTVTSLLAWSNTQHRMVWVEHHWQPVGQWGYFSIEKYGPWFWANGIYFYCLLIYGALLMVLEVQRSPRIFRQQSYSMIAGALLPLTMNLVYIFDLFPSLVIDFTPLAFAFSGLAFVLSMLRHRLLSLSPVGRAALIESMLDPMLVLDDTQRVVDLNPAAQRFLGIALEDSLGRPFSQVWPAVASIALPAADATRPLGWTSAQHLASRVPPIITTPDRAQTGSPERSQTGERSYELHISPLKATGALGRLGQVSGWLVVLHDLTLRRQAEVAVEEANSALTVSNMALQRLNEELEERVAIRTESLHQRAAELEVLTRVSDVLRQSDTLEILLNQLICEATAALGYGAGAVLITDDGGLRVAAVCNLPTMLVNSAHPINNETLLVALKTGAMVHLHISQLLPKHMPAFEALNKTLTGGIVVPMKVAGRGLGLLIFFFNASHSPSQEWPLTTIAEMGANAIQRLRVMDTLEQVVLDRTRDLSVLYDITSTTNAYQELDTVLARILAKALEVLHGHIGMVHLLFEQSDSRYTLSDQPREAQAALRLTTAAGLDTLAASIHPEAPGPWSQVIENNRILVLPDVFDLSGAPNQVNTDAASVQAAGGPETNLPAGLLEVLRQELTHTYVGIPIGAKGRTLGVMSVFGLSLAHFSAEDIALLAAIADHVGGAVENAQLRQKAEQAAVVEERQRLARDLHDSVTQSLYSLVLFSSAARDALDPVSLHENDELPAVSESPGVQSARKFLQRLVEVSQQALRELRLLIFELRPLALQKEGLISALRSRLETVEQRSEMRAVLLAEQAGSLPAEIENGLYGIAQEALNNTLRHAHASLVTVRYAVGPELIEMEISDDGCGFDSESPVTSVGFGLASMRERAALMGGELTVRSEIGRGTRVVVTLARAKQPFDGMEQTVKG